MKKKIAVIVYIPSRGDLIQQFFALYYSVMMHPNLREQIDFIVGCDACIQALFKIENCYLSHCIDLSQDEAYQFKHLNNEVYGYINSWSHFVDPHSIDIILNYDYALRIDVDSFISPAILDIELDSQSILTGIGGYIGGQETKDNILRISHDLDMRHRGIHNIGSTWFANAQTIVETGKSALACAQHLLQHEFHDHGEWPRWYALVTTMYAGELALNHSGLINIDCSEKLDATSTSTQALADVYTIHSWHTEDFFSKHRYAAGDYQQRATPLNIEHCCDYAFFCTRLSEIAISNTRRAASPNYLTPAQATRTALSLLKQAIPRLPAQIRRKFFP